MTRVLWVSGTFRLCNQALADLRSAGHYEGRSTALHLRKVPGYDAFTNQQAAIRAAVAGEARHLPAVERPFVVRGDARVALAFYIFGHGRHDPSSWYLVGKAAEDGLADAGVLTSDRFDVWDTTGRVLRRGDEDRARVALSAMPVARALPIKGPGLAVVLTSVPCREG